MSDRQSHSPRTNAELVRRFLDVVETDIVPLTEQGVASGNKVFGAALVAKSDLSLVLAATNNEMANPLWHGEMHALKLYYELPEADRVPLKDCYFISTHEPCSMCLSAITWAGLDNFHYFFSHQNSRDMFAIPHDLRILKQVFGLDADGYAKSNAFWQCRDLVADAKALQNPPTEQIDRIVERYETMSANYQANKDQNAIPLA
ncbi:MAG: nucleoside deaminase [Pseudomonadota bacterium]